MAWIEDERVMYARSSDGGDTFGPSMTMSEPAEHWYGGPGTAGVARDKDAHVIVTWVDYSTGKLRMRLSANGGADFGGPKTVTASSTEVVGLALGDGVIYVAYYEGDEGDERLAITRSIDWGDTWEEPVVLSTSASAGCGADITADGNDAYLVTAPPLGGSVFTFTFEAYRTVDRGTSWSGPLGLTSATASACGPALSLQGGVVRFVYTWHPRSVADAGQVTYRESSDGIVWSADERLPVPTNEPRANADSSAADVALEDNVLILYDVAESDTRTSVWVQLAKP